METLFETYVGKKIRREFTEADISVSLQVKNKYLFDNPQKFNLKPDIVVYRDNTREIILDTKWKRLNINQKKNYGISQSDMYQMYAYAKKYDVNKVVLLYPQNKETELLKDIIQYKEYPDLTVLVFFVDLVNIDK